MDELTLRFFDSHPGALPLYGHQLKRWKKNSVMRFTQAKPALFTWLNSYAYG